jgi:hypothetical protein
MPVLTHELTHEEILEALDKAPTVDYPDEVLQRLDREYLVAKAQMASGELKPMSAREFAAEYGITLDDDED